MLNVTEADGTVRPATPEEVARFIAEVGEERARALGLMIDCAAPEGCQKSCDATCELEAPPAQEAPTEGRRKPAARRKR